MTNAQPSLQKHVAAGQNVLLEAIQQNAIEIFLVAPTLPVVVCMRRGVGFRDSTVCLLPSVLEHEMTSLMIGPLALTLPRSSDQASNLAAIVGNFPSPSRAVRCLEDWFFGQIAIGDARLAYERAQRRFAAWSSKLGFT